MVFDKYGVAKGDGAINICDVIFLRKLLVTPVRERHYDHNIFEAADYNADMQWDITDLVQMRSFIINNV